MDDLEGRFRCYLKILAQEEGRPKALVVDTGHRQARFRFSPDGQEEATKERHLYHADVILTTLDKLLYRYFGYAEGSNPTPFPGGSTTGGRFSSLTRCTFTRPPPGSTSAT